jgi:KUP system potassium uptake protein
MAETLQPAMLPRQGSRKQTAVAALTALGIVYGDIGTSTLYGLKQAVEAGGTPTPDTVMGTVSVILWSILLIVALKYAILILRADNHGEGGIMALLALLDARHAPPGSWRASLLIVGLIGAALLYGDGVITRRSLCSALSKVSRSMRRDSRQWSFLSPSQSLLVCSWSSAGERSSSAASSGR